MAKLNCWEVMGCGREIGGSRVGEDGPCPAATETRLHSIHGGTNGGRACWGVPKTFCGDDVYDTVAEKNARCQTCLFALAVRVDEGANYLSAMALMNRMREAV